MHPDKCLCDPGYGGDDCGEDLLSPFQEPLMRKIKTKDPHFTSLWLNKVTDQETWDRLGTWLGSLPSNMVIASLNLEAYVPVNDTLSGVPGVGPEARNTRFPIGM